MLKLPALVKGSRLVAARLTVNVPPIGFVISVIVALSWQYCGTFVMVVVMNTLSTLETGTAAKYKPSPGCLAVMVVVPRLLTMTFVPLILATAGLLLMYVAANPEVLVAFGR